MDRRSYFSSTWLIFGVAGVICWLLEQLAKRLPRTTDLSAVAIVIIGLAATILFLICTLERMRDLKLHPLFLLPGIWGLGSVAMKTLVASVDIGPVWLSSLCSIYGAFLVLILMAWPSRSENKTI